MDFRLIDKGIIRSNLIKMSLINHDSFDFQLGYLFAKLEENHDLDFDEFIWKLNDNKKNGSIINIETLKHLCNLYCSDVCIINYKNEEVVVVGEGTFYGVVYLNKINRVAKMEYEDEEIEAILDDADTDSEAS